MLSLKMTELDTNDWKESCKEDERCFEGIKFIINEFEDGEGIWWTGVCISDSEWNHWKTTNNWSIFFAFV